MSDHTDDFFKNKRSWSKIKDEIIRSYMPPYLNKLNRRENKILLIDAFAGPGKFENGDEGSPFIFCRAAEKYVPSKYEVLFINNNEDHHEKLLKHLKQENLDKKAKAILGDSTETLNELSSLFSQPLTILLYMDPFGLGIPFETLRPFLNRKYSTELLINLSAPILHRLAGKDATKLDEETVEQRHGKLTSIFGGDYWKKHLWNEAIPAKQREEGLVKEYMSMLTKSGNLKYTGACPIQATRESQTKYYMIFVSGHQDAMILLNDNMVKNFENFMTEQETQGTMFADLSWKDWRDTKEIKRIAFEAIEKQPGRTREDVWIAILKEHFLRFTGTEYRKAIKELLQENLIESPTSRRSRTTLNDDCVLNPVKQ
jgi:three-Cys-motif partner protein